MRLLKGNWLSIIKKTKHSQQSNRSRYIFFKIVNSKNGEYRIQCINNKATFRLTLSEIVEDIDILYGLHPEQACFVGLEHALAAKKSDRLTEYKNINSNKLSQFPIMRYGRFRVFYENRDGDICFVDQKKNQNYLMDPRDIALSKEIIEEFDAIQAYYIGFVAGLRLSNPITGKTYAKPALILVKS